MWRIRHFLESVKNLIIWFPVIWKDRQWDSAYIEDILLKKIILMRKYHEKGLFFVGVENEIKWMKKCEYLLTMLIESKYWDDEWDNKKPSRNQIEHTQWTEWMFENERTSYADLWEEKTRTLFWKIFIWKYQYWWD